MTRLLYVTTSTTIGGAEKTLYTLATLVDPKLFEVAGVVSLKPKGFFAERLEAAGTRVSTLDIKVKPGLRDLQRLAVLLHELKPDLVHAVMYQAIQLCRAVKRLGYAEFRLISSPRVHYRTRSGLTLWLDSYLKAADDLLITECEASRKYMVEKLGYPAAKVETIYNGVDLAGWPLSKTDRARRRAELKLPENAFLIGSVGRLDEQKGHVYLLETVAKLKATHPVKCAILGDGPLKPFLEEMVIKLGLSEDVFLLGERKDVPNWLSAFDVFVLPSLWEGVPNALLEAMAIGLAVVATRVDGVPEIVQHDITGILCGPKDPQALLVPIQDMIMDPDLRKRLGEAARVAISENFKLAGMIAKYEAAYARVAGVGQEEASAR